ncbi:MAG: cation-translocating P-type ATPase [Candidatus Sericytochromatia bacterium]
MNNCFHCNTPIKGNFIEKKFKETDFKFCCLGCSIAYELVNSEEVKDKESFLEDLIKNEIDIKEKKNLNFDKTDSFYLKGITCTSCSPIIEKVLTLQEGVSEAKVNLVSEKVKISFDSKNFNLNKTKKELKKFGYTLIEKNSLEDIENITDMYLLRLASVWFLSMNIMSFSMGIYYGQLDNYKEVIPAIIYIQAFLCTIVVFVLGYPLIKSAIMKLTQKKLSMETLVVFGTLTSYFYSLYETFYGKFNVYYDTASMIIAFVLLGKFLENSAKNKAGKTIKKLMTLNAKSAKVIENNLEIEKNIDEIKIDDIVIVKAGEKIPLDGIIIEGESHIDESMITGEYKPVSKKVGNRVFSATINQDNYFIFKVTETSENTTLAKIIDLVEKAQNEKTEFEKVADKISAYFIPIVFLLAILTWVLWVFFTQNNSIALMNAIAVLVVACPCALGLAVPMATHTALDKSAEKGIIIKNSNLIEELNKITTIITDKTGTLTEGKMKVVKVEFSNHDYSEDLVLKLIGSIEKYSEHPIAKSIVNYVKEKEINLDNITNFQITKGLGVEGNFKNFHIKIGNKNFIEKDSNNIITTNDNKNSISTMVFCSINNKLVASLFIEDNIKEKVKETLDNIRAKNLKVIMLTGDNKNSAEYIAKNLGISEFYYEQLPADKLNFISNLQKKGEKILMIGDGINDAPSLVKADIGVSVSNAGDISIEASDITFMKNDFDNLLKIFYISELSLKYLKINIIWAFSYNFVSIPLAMLGFLQPIFAAAFMAISSLLIIRNSLVLKKDLETKFS